MCVKKKKKRKIALDMVEVVEYMPSKLQFLNPNPHITKNKQIN
jgi:hypothetical protein